MTYVVKNVTFEVNVAPHGDGGAPDLNGPLHGFKDMYYRAPRIDPTSRRGRKLIDATFRAIAKWRPTCEWGAVVVQQPNC